jgi:hypothetical protein
MCSNLYGLFIGTYNSLPEIAYQLLARYLTGSKKLNHLLLLWFAIIDDCVAKWLPNKDNIIQILLENIITTVDFSNTGNKEMLATAIKQVIHFDDSLLGQPGAACWRILKWASVLAPEQTEQINKMTSNKYLFLIAQSWLSMAKKNGIIVANDRCWELMYQCQFGIPQKGTDRLLEWNHPDLVQFIGSQNMPSSIIISPLTIAEFIYMLTSCSENIKPMALWDKLKTRTSNYGEIFTKYGDLTDTHIPGYAVNNRPFSTPSKFYFMSDRLCTGLISGRLCQISDKMKILLAKKLVERYGSFVPNSGSKHTNTASIVAAVMATKYNNSTEYQPSMLLDVMDIIKESRGIDGNIYHSRVPVIAYVFIIDFLRVKKQPFMGENLSFGDKLLAEAKINNALTISDDIITIDTDRIQLPIMLDIERDYSHIIQQALNIYNSK